VRFFHSWAAESDSFKFDFRVEAGALLERNLWDCGKNPVLNSVYLTDLIRFSHHNDPHHKLRWDRNGSTGQAPLLELKTLCRYDQGLRFVRGSRFI